MSTSILSPKSIAVVGASDKKGSVGRAITNNIIKGYKGPIYPISPSRPKVFGIKAYKSVLDVPKKIDLAVIVTKNTIVPYVLEECGTTYSMSKGFHNNLRHDPCGHYEDRSQNMDLIIVFS